MSLSWIMWFRLYTLGPVVKRYAFLRVVLIFVAEYRLIVLVVPQQQTAQQVLAQFQEHPDAWQKVPLIMEISVYPQTKVRHCNSTRPIFHSDTASQYIGLQILEKLINTRWKTLPEDQRQGTCATQSLRRSSNTYQVSGTSLLE